MVNLVLHCGARHVDRRAVEEAKTPAASETWVPIPIIGCWNRSKRRSLAAA